MIPQPFIQDLLHRVDIVDVVDRYVKLKRAGANYVACCPFHSEKTPSFTVSPTKQFYHCFGCGAHGTAIGFMMEYGGMGFVDAVKDLAQSVGMTVPEERSEHSQKRAEQSEDLHSVLLTAAQYYRACLKDAPHAIAYLKKPRAFGRCRQALRDRLRARRLAGPGWRRFPTTARKRSSRRASSSRTKKASATTSSATASCSRSSTCAAT